MGPGESIPSSAGCRACAWVAAACGYFTVVLPVCAFVCLCVRAAARRPEPGGLGLDISLSPLAQFWLEAEFVQVRRGCACVPCVPVVCVVCVLCFTVPCTGPLSISRPATLGASEPRVLSVGPMCVVCHVLSLLVCALPCGMPRFRCLVSSVCMASS